MIKAPTWPLPRIGSTRHAQRKTIGIYYADVCREMGITPYGWQRWVTDASLELVPRPPARVVNINASRLRLAATSVGLLVGRQSGKSLWTASRVGLQCLLPEMPKAAKLVGVKQIVPQHVGITAQDRIGALARWYEHVDMIMDGGLAPYVANVRRKNGEEQVRFLNGSTYSVITPSRTGARGYHLDLVVIDEALAHESWLLSVLRPTMAQRDGVTGSLGAQLVIVSNAGDQTSELLNEQRELGRRAVVGDDHRRAWFEWSAPDDCDPFDEQVWFDTLPTLEQLDGISLEFMRGEAESMRIEDFRREYLCMYTPRRHAYVIEPAQWESAPDSPISDGPVVIGIDAPPERTSASIVAANESYDGRVSIEVLEQRMGTDWVVAFLVDLSTRNDILVAVDGYGPLSTVIGPLERAGVVVHTFKVGDVVNAAANLAELVQTGGLAHQKDPRFIPAAVTRRKVGDRWALQRTGDNDISPFVAASLACWAVSEGLLVPPTIH